MIYCLERAAIEQSFNIFFFNFLSGASFNFFRPTRVFEDSPHNIEAVILNLLRRQRIDKINHNIYSVFQITAECLVIQSLIVCSSLN